jgi:ABC-2 type transport system permease protein
VIELVQIELFKLFRQRRTYVALIALAVIELFVLAVAYYQGRGILDSLLEGLRDSFIFEGELLNGNLVSYFILNSLWFHLPLIIMIITSGLMTTEYEEGTVRTVFLQKVSIRQFIIGKYLTAMIFTVLVVAFLAVSALGLSYLLFGTGDLVVYFGGLTFFDQQDALKRLVLAFGAGAITMLFYSMASLTLGIIMRQTIKTWILSALLLVISNLLLQLDLNALGMEHWFYAGQLDSWQQFFRREIPWLGVSSALGVLLLYTFFISWFGVRFFGKKEIG